MTSHANINTVCAIPVSKRNFVNRHGHGLVHSAKDVKTRVDQKKENFGVSPMMTCSPCSVSEVQESRAGLAGTPYGTHRNDPHHARRDFDAVNNLEFDFGSQLNPVPKNCRRVPCRARCMPTEHNAATAYFEIPNDAFHGMPLSCSMPKCRGQSGGPRFRYCKGKLSRQFHRKTRQASHLFVDFIQFVSALLRDVTSPSAMAMAFSMISSNRRRILLSL